MSQLITIIGIRLLDPNSNESGITHYKYINHEEHQINVLTKAYFIKKYAFLISHFLVKSGAAHGPTVTLVKGNPPYLKTPSNSTAKDNLLNLPRF